MDVKIYPVDTFQYSFEINDKDAAIRLVAEVLLFQYSFEINRRVGFCLWF